VARKAENDEMWEMSARNVGGGMVLRSTEERRRVAAGSVVVGAAAVAVDDVVGEVASEENHLESPNQRFPSCPRSSATATLSP
jgi:hypothetical protein